MIDSRDDDLEERRRQLCLADSAFDGFADTRADFDFGQEVVAAEAEADAAHLRESLTLIIGGHQELKSLLRRFESHMAQRTQREAVRDAELAGRLVAPGDLSASARLGAQSGAQNAVEQSMPRIEAIVHRVEAVNATLQAETAAVRRDRAKWANATGVTVIIGIFAMLAMITAGYALGFKGGKIEGYAKARDETAASAWANTVAGKFARQLGTAGKLDQMRQCSADGWQIYKISGHRVCVPLAGKSGTTGWFLP